MPGVINQDGQPLTWTAKYWRYKALYEAEFDSLDEAQNFLERGEDDGELYPDSIVGPDGRVVDDEPGKAGKVQPPDEPDGHGTGPNPCGSWTTRPNALPSANPTT